MATVIRFKGSNMECCYAQFEERELCINVMRPFKVKPKRKDCESILRK